MTDVRMQPVTLVFLADDGVTETGREPANLPEPLYDTAVEAGESGKAMVLDVQQESNGPTYTLLRVNLDEYPPELVLVPVKGGTPIFKH